MSSLTRYSMSTMESGSSGETYARMLPNTSGDWTLYADVCAAIEAQAQRIVTLEALRVKYGPICLNCGKTEPCMTEAEANQHGGSIPCTFDPAPRELWDRCQQQAQRIRELEGAIIGLETLLKETRTLHDEYTMAAMTALAQVNYDFGNHTADAVRVARQVADEAMKQRNEEQP